MHYPQRPLAEGGVQLRLLVTPSLPPPPSTPGHPCDIPQSRTESAKRPASRCAHLASDQTAADKRRTGRVGSRTLPGPVQSVARPVERHTHNQLIRGLATDRARHAPACARDEIVRFTSGFLQPSEGRRRRQIQVASDAHAPREAPNVRVLAVAQLEAHQEGPRDAMCQRLIARASGSTSARGVARTSAGDRDQRRPASMRRTYRARIVFAPTGAIRTPRNGPSPGGCGARAETDGPCSPRHIWVSERVVAPARRPSGCRAVALATAVAASPASLPHVLDRPPPEKGG